MAKTKKPEKKPMHEKPMPGDFVEVKLLKKSYKGTLLESPKDEKNLLLLKLDSGYNIGFDKKKIFSFNVIEKAKHEKVGAEASSADGPKNKDKPKVAMIITGGTIASRLDSKTGGVSPLTNPSDLFKFYPEMFDIVDVVRVERPFMKFSEDMDFKDWQKLAKTTAKLLNDPHIKGIIITHGTDTLHYTSAALSFMLAGKSNKVNKPIVLTYSQRSIDRASSDANLNLQCAAIAAISDIAEVMLVGHATTEDTYCVAIPGTKAKKLHTSRRDTFKSVNAKPFAKIFPNTGGSRIDVVSEYNSRSKSKMKKINPDVSFEEKVALVKVYPGQDPDILNYYIKKKYKGIVLETTGLGHMPTRARKPWLKKINEVIGKGIFVCAAAQTIFGRLDPYVYSSGRELLDAGVIFLEDMLAEVAYVKLGWILGHKEWAREKGKVKDLMLTNFAHELNDRLEE